MFRTLTGPLIGLIFATHAWAQQPATLCLSDESLRAHLPALIYVWSPRMAMSAQQASVARNAARQAGLAFVPTHDPSIPPGEIRATLARLGASTLAHERDSALALSATQALCASTLVSQNATRHFPSAFVAQVHTHPTPIVGVMPANAWTQAISARIDSAPPATPLALPPPDLPVPTPSRSAALQAHTSHEACIAPNAFHALSAELVGSQTDAYGQGQVILGSYERISPDGRFVLRSFSGGRLGEVSLIELDERGRPIAAHDTPLSNEAFPVQGSWRYIVNINGDHYPLRSIVQHSPASPAKPVFRGGMTGFYAAAAELHSPSGANTAIRIRSVSWPNATGDTDSQGEGALQARTLTIDTASTKILADTGAQYLCTHRAALDGTQYALPMISVDGEEFAALPQLPVRGQPTMRIFGFGPDGKGCTPQAQFGFSSGKTIFGFPQVSAGVAGHGSRADLAYEYQGQIWWFHRGPGMAEGVRLNIAPYEADPRVQWIANAFPGITRDGRIIYAATRRDCRSAGQPCTDTVGYITADPYQSHDYLNHLQAHPTLKGRSCITHADVQRERKAFAAFHGLNASND